MQLRSAIAKFSDCRAEAAEKKAEQLEPAYPGISTLWRRDSVPSGRIHGRAKELVAKCVAMALLTSMHEDFCDGTIDEKIEQLKVEENVGPFE